ncbi:MAG: 1-deoxy-D-xylulose-5-phosphate reductoisomerase [Candidatus Gygaella obscura]|nr:1-deoxy-D-xylulose-5-phosphate reductoisomerase [Candidatus Gygaella obscura]
MGVKKIAVLGSTGSIGQKTLEIINQFPDRFQLQAIACWSNTKELEKQVKKYKPKIVAVGDSVAAKKLKIKRKILIGQRGIDSICAQNGIDIVVVAINATSALSSILIALKSGKDVALANKEALVMAGSVIMKTAKRYKAKVLPIDSEQSAIWQCLEGNDKDLLQRVYLTASGGSLYKVSASRFSRLTKKEILTHPRWKMGAKITVDSATLMNKALEIIEAMWLFDLDFKQISVLIHPEAIIHSMVEFIDGSVIAQLGITDMRLPIQYALSYPQRLNSLKRIDFPKLGVLHFDKPDLGKFRCLRLGIKAAKTGGSLPCVLNAANEVVVNAFLKDKIPFLAIPEIIERVMIKHKVINNPDLDSLYDIDNWTRVKTQELLCRF